jgi:hypothetical protein
MLNVGDSTDEGALVPVGGARGHVLLFVDANFCGVIIEHTGQNVVHVPGEVIGLAGVIEDLSSSESLEESVEPLVSVEG